MCCLQPCSCKTRATCACQSQSRSENAVKRRCHPSSFPPSLAAALSPRPRRTAALPCHGKYEAGKQTGPGKDHACPGFKSEPINVVRAIPGCCKLPLAALPSSCRPSLFSPPPPPPTTAPTAPVSQLGQLCRSATLPGAVKGGLREGSRVRIGAPTALHSFPTRVSRRRGQLGRVGINMARAGNVYFMTPSCF